MAGQYRTSIDLINEALANLGVLSAGQPTDPEDFNYVKTKLDPTFRKLAALEIVYVPDPENIPGPFFSDLADILAGECATKFGSTLDDQVTLINRGLGGAAGVEIGAGTAAKSLKQITRGRPTYETQRTEYF